MLSNDSYHPHFAALCEACKNGSFDTVKFLVQHEVPINCQDVWNCVPLYYAALCGHADICKFLLENGASCDPASFVGERCLYGALTDDIKNMLKAYKVSKTIDPDSDYALFMLKLLNGPDQNWTNVKFKSVDGVSFQVHSLILASRSSLFRALFGGSWKDRSFVPVQHASLTSYVLSSVFRYLYAGQLGPFKEFHKDLLFVARKWQLNHLASLLESNEHVPRDIKSVKADLARISFDILKHGHQWCLSEEDDERFEMLDACRPDVIVQIQNRYYPTHKAFLCRSEYFRVIMNEQFCDLNGDRLKGLSILTLKAVTEERVFDCIIEFLYSEEMPSLSSEIAHHVIMAGDLLLLDKLRTDVTLYICNLDHIPQPGPFEWLRTAWTLQLPKLEQNMCRRIARDLTYIHHPEFAQIVQESASSILERQETDTIEFVDDLRYWISKECRISEDKTYAHSDPDYLEYTKSIQMLDQVLNALGIDI